MDKRIKRSYVYIGVAILAIVVVASLVLSGEAVAMTDTTTPYYVLSDGKWIEVPTPYWTGKKWIRIESQPNTPAPSGQIWTYDIAQNAWVTASPAPAAVIVCSESDGGNRTLVAGTCTDSTGTYTDFCVDEDNIAEYVCVNDACVKSMAGTTNDGCYALGKSCVNGACV